jgi:hypothetical protein
MPLETIDFSCFKTRSTVVYLDMTSGTKKRMVWSVSVTIGLVLLLGVFGPAIQYKETTRWICPVSGSTRNEIIWFGHFSHEERTVSALEKWLKRREPDFVPHWQVHSRQTYSVMSRSCALWEAPEIYQLSPILNNVVEKLSDAQIAALVTVLRTGSPDEQKQMIERISAQFFAEASPGDKK